MNVSCGHLDAAAPAGASHAGRVSLHGKETGSLRKRIRKRKEGLWVRDRESGLNRKHERKLRPSRCRRPSRSEPCGTRKPTRKRKRGLWVRDRESGLNRIHERKLRPSRCRRPSRSEPCTTRKPTRKRKWGLWVNGALQLLMNRYG